MDELQMIATMLDEPPTQESEDAVRHRVLNGMRAPQRPERRAWRRPALWSGLGLTATAAAVTGAVVLSSGTTPRAPDPGAAGPQPMTAKTVLLTAATKAEGAPAGHGRYWSSVIREGGYVVSDSGQHYTVREIGSWDAGPGKDAWVAERVVSSRYTGPAPAGGPSPSGGPVNSPNRGPVTRPGPGKWTKSKVKGGEAFRLADWEGTDPPDVRRLPADPQALRRFLNRTLPDHADPAEWLMSNAQKVGAAPVKPRVLAAMYRLLAAAPGLRGVGAVTDPLGRRGEGVARRVRADGTVLDERLVIDPATGRLLAQESVLVTPGKAWAGRKPGTVVSYDALVSCGWTDKVPAYPVEKAG
ncbi:CU044_5270 family protein [Actinomadura violacea]|uniref:CU044_5270 family protein n=1 Tax=Actinomadura violacea TaxID=2819934 RepID=A0ABS3SC46_9ACTN|nr:CU044_5270 family protein [Actinomadura violacea]MBO2465805.1 CU044_5270 family protein [Actinomadura violacea]